MKIRAKANGNIIDVSDGEAEALIAAGIYEPTEETNTMPPKTPKAEKPATPKPSSTKVAPMTTKDMPKPPKKVG